MNELYWLTTLSNVCKASVVLLTISVLALVVLSFVYFGGEYYDVCDDVDKLKFSAWKKWFKAACITFAVSFLLLVFIPSERQLYLIYGVGGTIDYIKENDTSKQIPDKTIRCLDKLMDEYLNDKKEK